MNTKLINAGVIGITGLFAGMAVGYRSNWVKAKHEKEALQETLDRAMANLEKGLKVSQDQERLIDELMSEIKRLKKIKRVK